MSVWLSNRGDVRLTLVKASWWSVTTPEQGHGTPRNPCQESWAGPVPLLASLSFHSGPACPEPRMEKRCCFVGRTGFTFMAAWGGEEDAQSPKRLPYQIWADVSLVETKVSVKNAYPSAPSCSSQAIPATDLKLISISGIQKQHPRASTRSPVSGQCALEGKLLLLGDISKRTYSKVTGGRRSLCLLSEGLAGGNILLSKPSYLWLGRQWFYLLSQRRIFFLGHTLSWMGHWENRQQFRQC